MIHLENKPSIINKSLFTNVVKVVCVDYNFVLKSITCVFLSDDELLKMNQEHLNHNYYTDIITFDLSNKENTLEGELYISIDRVKENATTYKAPFELELYRVMIHGILHLVGLGDKTKEEKIEIRKKEDEYLTLLK